MSGSLHCPRCGTRIDLEASDTSSCPQCGWRTESPESTAAYANLTMQLLMVTLGGLIAGAIVAHSLVVVLFTFLILGPLAAATLGRRAPDHWGWWVLTYSVAFGLGILWFPDGQTISPDAWHQASSAAGITAFFGLVSGLFTQS